jgi:hypothetical protein
MLKIMVILPMSVWCLALACTVPLGNAQARAAVSLDGKEVSCMVPRKGYVLTERQTKEGMASLTYDCPSLMGRDSCTVTPVFSLYIEKLDSACDPAVYNNRSRAVYEARTIAMLAGPEAPLGAPFIETLQQRRYGSVMNTIYQATTVMGTCGIRVVFQVPSDGFDQGYGEIIKVVKTVKAGKRTDK